MTDLKVENNEKIGHYGQTLIKKHSEEQSIENINNSIEDVQKVSDRLEKYFEIFMNEYAKKNGNEQLTKTLSEEKETKQLDNIGFKINAFLMTKLGLFILKHSSMNLLESNNRQKLFESFRHESLDQFLKSLNIKDSIIKDVIRSKDSQIYYEKERLKIMKKNMSSLNQ